MPQQPVPQSESITHVSGNPPSKSNPPSTPSGTHWPAVMSHVEPVLHAMHAEPAEPVPQRWLVNCEGAKHIVPEQQPLQLPGPHAPDPMH